MGLGAQGLGKDETRLYGPPGASDAPPRPRAVPLIAIPQSPSRSAASSISLKLGGVNAHSVPPLREPLIGCPLVLLQRLRWSVQIVTTKQTEPLPSRHQPPELE